MKILIKMKKKQKRLNLTSRKKMMMIIQTMFHQREL